MRITARISSSGDYWHPQWPRIDIRGAYPVVDGRETFDEPAFRRMIRDCRNVQFGSDDWGAPVAFAALLIQTVNDWMDDNERGKDDKSRRIDSRLNRRLDCCSVSFCRIDLTAVRHVLADGAIVRTPKVRIVTDDGGVVQKEHYERDFAMLLADVCREYSKKFVARGDAPVVFASETERLLDELHERTVADDVRKANENRLLCDRYRNGQCSPCKFDCPHYESGRCVAVSALPGDYDFTTNRLEVSHAD